MKEVFQVIETMKRERVVEDYAVTGAVGALAAEALRLGRAKDIQRVSMLLLAEGFDADLFEDIVKRFSLEDRWKRVEAQLEDIK